MWEMFLWLKYYAYNNYFNSGRYFNSGCNNAALSCHHGNNAVISLHTSDLINARVNFYVAFIFEDFNGTDYSIDKER